MRKLTMSDNIKVAIKVRPLIKREKEENLPIQWATQGNAIMAIDAEMKKRNDVAFQFDHIFDTDVSNNDIFDSIVKPLVDATVNGFNSTVFAYGQTSSGKTYTMMGNSEEPGIIPLAVNYMFDAIASTMGREFLLRVSYLEIYNERINDLLNKEATDLKVHEDINGQVFVKCKEEVTNCPENVLLIMSKGNKNRRIGETNMNERSSRSHTIFKITIESREVGADSDGAIQVSQLNMVDLAGSERARQTGATGERFKEGRHINLSLSTLSLVIKQLSESPDREKYINFRDSKLTRLLQTSLGGNTMTAIICAVTPAALDETQCTLSFAARAKSIQNKPQLNEVMSDGVLLKRYAKQIDKLHAELERVKQMNRFAEVEEMESKIQEKDRMNEFLEERIRLLQTRIVAGDNRNNIQAESFKCKAKRRRTWCGTGRHKSLAPTFQPCVGLSPIKEMSPPKLRDRKSFSESTDIIDTSFQIAFADFELELMKSEADREEENDSDEDTCVTYRKDNHVKFKDNVIVHKTSIGNDSDSNIVHEKIDTCTQTNVQSPDTPKENLRKCIRHLTKEFSELQEYTTLEKQLNFEDHHCEVEEKLTSLSSLEKQLENVISDKNAFEHIASDLRKKLTAAELRYASAEDKLNLQVAELKRIPDLEKKLAELSQEKEAHSVSESHTLQNQIILLTAEKDGYQHVVSELQKKLNKADQHIFLLEHKSATQNVDTEHELATQDIDTEEEPLIRFSIENENIQQLDLKTHVLESEKDELKRELSDLQNNLTEAELFNGSMKDKLNEQMMFAQNFQELEDKISSLTSERSVFEHTISEMQDKLRKMEEDNNLLKDRLSKRESEIEKFQDQEKRIEQFAFEKHELERIIDEMMQKKEIKTEATNTSMEMECEMDKDKQDINKLRELEKQIQDIATEKMRCEQINEELKDKLKEAELMNSSMKNNLSEQQQCVQKINDLEKQIEDLTIEKNGFKIIITELKENLEKAELTLQNKLNEHETGLRKINDLHILEKNKFERTISELQEKLTEIESYNSIKEELNTREMEAQNVIEEQKKCVENFALEKSKLEDTIRELREKEAELHDNLMRYNISEQVQLQKNNYLEKEIECLTSKMKEFEFMVHDLQEKLAETEHSTLTQETHEQQVESQRIQELQAPITKLTSENSESEKILMELLMKSPSKKDICSDDNEIDLKCRINDLEGIIQDIQRENSHLKEQISAKSAMLEYEHDLSNDNASKIIEDLSNTGISLEDSVKLSADLVLKTQELDEIKHDVRSLKRDIENLQKTIYLLTTENTELANKLSKEKECSEKLTVHFQKTIDELYARNSKITDEKFELENNLTTLNEQMKILRSKMPEMNLDKEQIILKYEEQINALTAKNTELLCNVADSMRELETLKESKSLLYEHDCMYKDKLTNLTEKHQHLMDENNELSTDLMDKIEENDGLRQTCDMLKNKLELSLKNKEEISNNDVEELRTENTILKTELMELKTNEKALTEKNVEISNQLVEAMEDLDNERKNNSCNNSLHMSMLFNNTLTTSGVMDKSVDGDPETIIVILQEKVNNLIRLNKRLSELKFGTCTQCIHLEELNENRRMLKLEVKSLTRKLSSLQEKFNRESAKTDVLIMKAKETFNTSLCDSSFDTSFSESANVTCEEEQPQCLNNETQTLKKNQDKLSDLEKCEIEESQGNNVTDSMLTSENVTKSPSKNTSTLDNIVKVVNNLQNDFQEIKENDLSSIRADLDKFTNKKESLLDEINSLRIVKEELLQKLSENESSLATALEKAAILENEITDMTKQSQELTAKCKEIENTKVFLEIEVESLREDKTTKEQMVGELRQNLSCLQHELDLIKKEKEELNNSNNFLENEYKKKLESLKAMNDELTESKTIISQKLADYTKDSENRFVELNEKINKCTSENDYLKQELIKLRDIESKFKRMKNDYQTMSQQDKTLAEDNKKLKDMLNTTSKSIVKEIKSLKPKIDTQEFTDKSVDKLFQIFLQTIMAKEKEIIKSMDADFDKEKQKLTDEKQQSVDAEKRTTLWVKELESEIEKLQGDLSEREKISDGLQTEVARLHQLLEENNRDRETSREKISLLETDLGNLQTELIKYTKIDTVNEEAVTAAQKREKQAQEAIKNKEIEFQVKLKSEKEAHNKRVEELTCTIESFKTKNLELTSNIEGLEANQKQLKNIVDLKTNELMKNSQIIQKMQTESEQLTEACNELNHELEEKKLRITEITELLKTKCDDLSEYKTNLETLMPENKFLKQQVSERKANIEQYKVEIDSLKIANEKAVDTIKDKLSLEELKNDELNKQIAELSNKNVTLTEEINTLRNDYDILQNKCITLEKRIRNSTSKIQVEQQIEELKDLNRSLRNNLDGASNRITELQTVKADLMKQLVTLNSQHDAVCNENKELKASSYKCNASATGEKYDVLLREKNQIALELEAMKVQLNQKNKDMEKHASEIKELTKKNAELDQESEELAEIIRQHDAEHARLQDQYYSCRIEVNTLRDKVTALEKKNQSLLSQSTLKMDVRSDKIEEFHNDECSCTTLKNKIRELQLEVISKNGKISTLELQIRSGSFPYQMKCKELQEHLSAYSNKNSELKAEVKRLQWAMIRVSAKECDVCKHRFINRTNQACQTMPSNPLLRFCSTSSGIIEDEIKITKLEKEKKIMKDICRSRSKTIKELEKRIEEYEEMLLRSKKS